MLAGFDIDQLHVDAQPAAAALHAAFQHVAHIEIPADLLQIGGLALVGERGAAPDHESAGDARQIGGQAFGDAVGEIFLLGIAADIGEREHDDRQPGRR
jgi:hypothetical protein